MRIFATLLIALSLLMTGSVFASTFPQPSANGYSDLGNSLEGGPASVLNFIETMTNWLFAIILTLAVIFILLAAYNYMSGAGGEGVEKAHKMLLYAAVGIAVAVLAKGIVFAVRKLVDSNAKPTTQVQIYNHHA